MDGVTRAPRMPLSDARMQASSSGRAVEPFVESAASTTADRGTTTDDRRRPPTGRAAARSTRSSRALEVVLVTTALLGVAEILVRSGAVAQDVLAPPTAIAGALVAQVQTGAFWSALLATASPWAVGLAVATAIAIPLGVILGLSAAAFRTTYLTVEVLRNTPTIAALPLLVLMYGIGFQMTVILVAWTAMWPLLIQTMYGVRDVDPVTVDTAKVYGLNRFRRITRVSVPSAVPFIATGMRISSVMAFIVAVAASLLVGGGGLGSTILSAGNAGQIDVMWARITAAGLVGLFLAETLRIIESRLLRWRPGPGAGR